MSATCACDTCSPLAEAGPQGIQGLSGSDGTNGTDGADAYSVTTAAYVQPNVGATVSVEVDRTDWMAQGQNIFITVGGYYNISSITDGTHVVVENLGATGNAVPTANVASGKKFTPSGPSQPLDAMDANSLRGNDTAASGTPVDIAVANNQFLARDSISNIEAKTISNFAFTLLDDTNQAQAIATIGAVPATRSLTGQYSITGGGDLSTNRLFNLVNDLAAPAPGQYYGTDSSGVRSWLPVSGAYSNISVFTSSGTWTKPTGFGGYILVIVTGGGGAGGSADSGIKKGTAGESGATAIKIIAGGSLGATETVTIGVGGLGNTGTMQGGSGATSSFGAHCSAAGGLGGWYSLFSDPQTPATATGGHINLRGSSMSGGGNYIGGSSLWGCGHSAPGLAGDGTKSLAYGSGGPPGASNSMVVHKGGDGADGVCVVLWS